VNENDHALVVGISRYLGGSEKGNWVPDLRGPDKDAAAIADWLRRPDGGGLDHDNVHVVRSSDFPDPFPNGAAAPQQYAIEAALTEIAFLPTNSYNEGGQNYAGRRLYIYVSGHGFAKSVDEAALITAEAVKQRPLNVLITSWLDWFYRAAHFKEFVLWVDTCLSNAPTPYLKACDLNASTGSGIERGRRFFAYAAGFNKQAVERDFDGEWHGVFTYALLQGLNGAVSGDVTSESLRDYLRNNMKSFMEDKQRVIAVSQEPLFGPVDPMTFGVPGERKTFPVKLRFPKDQVGKQATVSVSASEPVVADTVLKKRVWQLKLEPGAYVAYLPESGKLGPFAVTGDNTGAIEPIQ
jgi:uncharacterized caspase-like protein